MLAASERAPISPTQRSASHRVAEANPSQDHPRNLHHLRAALLTFTAESSVSPRSAASPST